MTSLDPAAVRADAEWLVRVYEGCYPMHEYEERALRVARTYLATTPMTASDNAAVRAACESLLAVVFYADNGYCSICHGHWPNEHREYCQGKRLSDAIDAYDTAPPPPADALTPAFHEAADIEATTPITGGAGMAPASPAAGEQPVDPSPTGLYDDRKELWYCCTGIVNSPETGGDLKQLALGIRQQLRLEARVNELTELFYSMKAERDRGSARLTALSAACVEYGRRHAKLEPK